jgi:hypothetical protein
MIHRVGPDDRCQVLYEAIQHLAIKPTTSELYSTIWQARTAVHCLLLNWPSLSDVQLPVPHGGYFSLQAPIE